MNYKTFLQTKQKSHVLSGFDINETDLNKSMFPFQKFIVKRAIKAGKYAIFADCGLGKTLMQLDWANQVSQFTKKKVLILAPLVVVEQTKREATKFNIPIDFIDADNYEQLNNIDTSIYGGVVLDESIGLSVFSPPFAELYTYSSHLEDMGNSKDYNEFLTQFSFLIKELYRVMMSGRNVCVHCMDIPIQKGKHGFIGLRDFSGLLLKAFEESGFIYASRITIWKDPVIEMQRTKALGLLHKQVKKDSTMSRVGIPDYVMIFRKDGERNNPVTNTELPVDLWQKYASPVWMDIDYGNTLQGFRNGRHENDEKHICPLQLDTIERLIHLYSNKGDTVLTPFMGIGSEAYQAVKMERKAIGFELKESYFDLAKKNLLSVVESKNQKTLF